MQAEALTPEVRSLVATTTDRVLASDWRCLVAVERRRHRRARPQNSSQLSAQSSSIRSRGTFADLFARLDSDPRVRGKQFERICKWLPSYS